MESYLRLSEVDKQILHSHALMLDGLGNFFGSTHEVILHSLENLESSAIKVINGHFSNRKEGAPITDMALKMLSQVESEHDYAVKPYYNKNQKGVILKSSTIPVLSLIHI